MKRGARGGRLLLAGLAAPLACLVAVACSPSARYRALSAVFDGVPPPPGTSDPNGAPATSKPQEELSAWQIELREAKATKPARVTVPVIRSVHRPVAERRCRECHDLDQLGGPMEYDATLCDRCHREQREREGWSHGPINLGVCIPCHVPHRSPHEHLLAWPVPELCLVCHDTLDPNAAAYHRVPNYTDCSACHDPHRMY